MKAIRWVVEVVVGAVFWAGFLVGFGFLAHLLWSIMSIGWMVW